MSVFNTAKTTPEWSRDSSSSSCKPLAIMPSLNRDIRHPTAPSHTLLKERLSALYARAPGQDGLASNSSKQLERVCANSTFRRFFCKGPSSVQGKRAVRPPARKSLGTPCGIPSISPSVLVSKIALALGEKKEREKLYTYACARCHANVTSGYDVMLGVLGTWRQCQFSASSQHQGVPLNATHDSWVGWRTNGRCCLLASIHLR